MKLPTLYSRRSDGKIQEWTIEVEDARYRTISGTAEGEKVTSEWTVCVSKNVGRANGTSPEEQATAEAQAAWTKKREHGYKDLVKEVDQQDYFEPMLAHKYEDYQAEIKYPVWSQPKIDGIRCIATSKGLFSRNGKPIVSAPHIQDQLKSYFNVWPEEVLDGELYAHELRDDFNRITSLVRKTKPTREDLAQSAAEIQYWIYDVSHPEKHFVERFGKVSGAMAHYFYPSLVVVETTAVLNDRDLDAMYARYLGAGFEGQIIRLNSKYENKRSKFLLKRKEFQDAEFQVLDIREGLGNRSGMAGYFVLQNEQGQIFNSNIKGDRNFLRGLLQRRAELVGKQATVQFFNYTPAGIPRFPFVIRIREEE